MAACAPESFLPKEGQKKNPSTPEEKESLREYPKATAFLLYGGTDLYYEDKIHFTPVTDFFRDAIQFFFRQA